MASGIDFNALKARTMASGNDEEAVTVNTRALIDKVLARYSGEWTVLRELLQNAADASATRVTIKFETIPSSSVPVPQSADPSTVLKHILSHHTLKRLLITNDGQPFNSSDWARLKRIAEGNPDDTKIGAFGVGFYSVFADCEEPFVSSGKEAMAFYWKGNSLFTRRLELENSDASPNTSFVLDYRNTTSPVPHLLPLCQFLASSLTFVGIEAIELWLDDWNILTLSKKTAPSVDITLPKDVETKSSEGLMKISKVTREIAQLDAKWMNVVSWKPPSTSTIRYDISKGAEPTPSLRSFLSRLAGNTVNIPIEKAPRAERVPDVVKDNLASNSKSTVFLHINTASIRTFVGQGFSQELERATKKPPPKTTKLAILTSSYDAEVASQSSESQTSTRSGDIFATVLPSRSGKIFIGFPTHQTTGLNAHISAPSVIPTVERESIDLNARWVRTWNLELLRAAGIVCRIAWSSEMLSIKDRVARSIAAAGKSKIRKEDIASVIPEAVHTSNQFTFRESTPSSQIGQVIEESFWTCNKKASIDILSTCGVIPSYEVRLAPKELSFMDGIPVLPDALVDGAKDFVKKLTDFGLVTEISVTDIKKELEANALTSKQLGEFLSWVVRKSIIGDIDRPTVQTLLNVAVANDESPDGNPSRVLVLAEIKCFVNPSRIPADLPAPPTVMPFKYTRSLAKPDLEALGWEELQIVPWLRWLVEQSGNRNFLTADQDISQSSAFASQILPVLSKQWDSLSQSSKSTVVELLQSRTVIPTKLGMRKPPETYFPTVRLFDDLPTVTGLNSVKEKFLSVLGVRKTVELGVVFERLLAYPPSAGTDCAAGKGKWSHVDLIKYLSSVRDDIPAADIERLKNTPICPAEMPEGASPESQERFKVSELFQPTQHLRSLGLPLIEWPSLYRTNSSEGRFLSMLGLRSFPSVSELISIMAKSASANNLALRDRALGYFLTQHHTNGYAGFDYSKVVTPFLPLQASDKLSTPNRCFTDEGAALLGFDILRRDLQPHAMRFGVRQNPPLTDCIDILIRKPPNTRKEAKIVFGYFAGRLAEINTLHAERLGNALVVPILQRCPVSNDVSSEKANPVRLVSPRNCFLGESDTYGDIFDFVDFGQEGNAFLLKCGSKHEPTKIEVARLLVKEPARISSTFQNAEKYLNLLRSLAESVTTLKKDRDLFKEMRRAPFLLASKELPSNAKSQNRAPKDLLTDDLDDFDEDEEPGLKEWRLTSAQEAIIVDDYQSFSLFKESILAAPQEEVLEDFYYVLGAPYLSGLVEEQARWGSLAPDQRAAGRLQKQIYERSRLFLHDLPSDMVKHDSRWLEKHLNVQAVQSISLRRSLKGRNVSHVEKRSAVVTHEQKDWTLWITASKYDMYQVSQALVHILLARPKLHSTLTLEMLLKTDLLELRARGYNVGRILRQKAVEARIAEDKRQKQLEEERKQIQQQEAEWNKSQERAAKEQSNRVTMPGVFPDSPDRPTSTLSNGTGGPHEEDGIRQPRGLLSNLTKRFGLDQGGRAHQQVQSLLNGTPTSNTPTATQNGAPPPPPYSQDDPQMPKSKDAQPVTSPHYLHQNLLSAIQSSRPHGSSDMYNRGETNQVNETKSYCDEHPSHDLAFTADSAPGVKIFLSKTTQNPTAFLTANTAGLNAFASLLFDCASIFAMRQDSINIFFDPEGKTIAFNRQGSIFCNYLYFQQLHQIKVLQEKERSDALVYWWVILCHELAHNLAGDHSSNHSYYTEGFVTQYFSKVVGKLGEYAAAAGSS